MRFTSIFAALIVAIVLSSGVALAAGPTPGRGAWLFCPNGSPVCASQLGSDLNLTNEHFDCLTKNGKPGIALQNRHNSRAHCWPS